jgi:hypothetical protein
MNTDSLEKCGEKKVVISTSYIPPLPPTTSINQDQLITCCPFCCFVRVLLDIPSCLPSMFVTSAFLLQHFSTTVFQVIPIDYVVRYFTKISSPPFSTVHCNLAFGTLAFLRPFRLNLHRLDAIPTFIEHSVDFKHSILVYRVNLHVVSTGNGKHARQLDNNEKWAIMSEIMGDGFGQDLRDDNVEEFCLQCPLVHSSNSTPLDLFYRSTRTQHQWKFFSRLLVWSNLQQKHRSNQIPQSVCLLGGKK